MKNWPWRKILFGAGCSLVAVGAAPLAALLWHAYTHNFQPLSMQLPLQRGTYTSAVFKTDLDENYIIQIEIMDATHRSVDLNPNAVLDFDWKIVDGGGAVIAQGAQNEPVRGANNVNLAEYKPKRGSRQRMIVDVHRDIAEPDGALVTLEVNSTEDPEGMAFGFALFLRWACLVGGPGAVILLVLLILRVSRPAIPETSSRMQGTL